MKGHQSWRGSTSAVLFLVILSTSVSWAQQQQVSRPPTSEDDNASYDGGLETEPRSENRRRYPDRSRQQQQGQQQGDRRSFSNYDPASAFRNSAAAEDRYNSAAANAASAEDLYGFSYDPNAPEDQSRGRNDNGGERRRQRPEQDYPRRNASNSGYNPTPAPGPRRATSGVAALGTPTPIPVPNRSSTRDPFNNPNRYRLPQQQQNRDQVHFVNGRPYQEAPNVQDRYGNRYDPRFHSIPGEYDPENDPRFSDPRYKDPRNLPKYNNNRQRVPQDRYDSKYRYYERFPDRQRDRLRDPNYDPRYDTDDPPAPGVLGGWLPELQGECRPGCENLPRDVTINTNYGRVNGFYVYLYDGPRTPEYDRPGIANVDKIKAKVSVFLGIPYAQPPTGEARLMPPRAHRGWQSYDAVDWAPVCPQPVRYVGATKNAPLMDEDCLFLNVFTPTTKSGKSQLLPVMFYIHGGEFTHGSGNDFPGHQLAAWGQVVVVTVNYRLGALGFLSTGDHHAPGNYGLLDQAMALKWVYDNVHTFQGDRERITVFGPGAGAASAGLLAVMPRSRSMVRRVIAMSGSPLADWASIDDKFRAMNTSLVFGERVGCTIENSWKLVGCVRRGRSFAELTNLEFKPEIGTWPWAPVSQVNISTPEDGWHEEWTSDDFMALPELVAVAYENQEYNPKLQYLTGVARDDASYLLYENKTLAPTYDVGWDFFDMMVRDHIQQYNYTLNPEGIFNAIKYMYTYYPDPNNRSHIREEFVNFWSDYYFRAPQDAIVKTLVRNRVDTYMYVQNTTVEALKLPYWRQITHNLEHFFLTGAPFMDPEFFSEDQQVSRYLWTESDRNMSEFFIYAFSNFSWYGDPTPKNILGVHWDMTKNGEILHYLAINRTENSTTLWNYRQRECAFWTEYLPSVIGYITPTYPPTTEFWWEPDSPLQIAFWSMSSVCLLLLVLVVVCCLLWRNAVRQAKDRYWDGGGSVKDFPPTSEFEGSRMMMGSTIGMDTLNTKGDGFVETSSIHNLTRPVTPVFQAISRPTTPHGLMMPPQTPILLPANSMNINSMGTMGTMGTGALTASNAGTLPMMGSAAVLPQYPQQPLPPTPATASAVPLLSQQLPMSMSSPQSAFHQDTSADSLPSAMSLGHHQHQSMDPRGSFRQQHQQHQQPRNSPGPVRRPIPVPTSNGRMGGPPPPPPVAVQQPMGLPRQAGKLVPGRMSSGRENQTQSRPGSSQGRPQRDISSTAV